MDADIKSGDIFKHHRGTIYYIIAVADWHDPHPTKMMVVYAPMVTNSTYDKTKIYVRPLEDFLSNVSVEIPRFEKVK